MAVICCDQVFKVAGHQVVWDGAQCPCTDTWETWCRPTSPYSMDIAAQRHWRLHHSMWWPWKIWDRVSLLSLDWWTCLGVIPNSEPICSHLCGRSNLALICHSMPFMITLWCSVSISALWSAMPHHSIPFLSILFNSRLFLIQYDSSIFNSSFFDILWYFYEVPKRIKFCSQKNTAVLVCCSLVWATWIWNRFGGRRALQIIA